MCWGRSGGLSPSMREQNEDNRRMDPAMHEPRKTIPHFANEVEERAFWESHDSTDYLDWTLASCVKPLADDLRETVQRLALAAVRRLMDMKGGTP